MNLNLTTAVILLVLSVAVPLIVYILTSTPGLKKAEKQPVKKKPNAKPSIKKAVKAQASKSPAAKPAVKAEDKVTIFDKVVAETLGSPAEPKEAETAVPAAQAEEKKAE